MLINNKYSATVSWKLMGAMRHLGQKQRMVSYNSGINEMWWWKGGLEWCDVLWEGLNSPFLTLEMEEGSQAVWAASRGWKNEETDEVAFGEVEVEYYPGFP